VNNPYGQTGQKRVMCSTRKARPRKRKVRLSSGEWMYYSPTTGKQVTGWQTIGGKWFYCYANSKLAVNGARKV